MDGNDAFTGQNRTREQQKEQLRRRMIEGENDRIIMNKKIRMHRIRIRIALGVLGLLIVAGIVYVIYRQNIRYFDGCRVTNTIEEHLSGTYEYVAFGENVVYYGKNSATYVGADGKAIWSKPYVMADPVVAIKENCIAIADRGGTTIVIGNLEGCTGTASTVLPIARIDVAGQGMVSAILEDEVANYITFYNKAGTKLNIEIKTLISGDGYPLDIALSPSGQDLMVSYVNIVDQGMKNKIMFYNFDVAQDQVDKLIAGFEHYETTLIPDVLYLNENAAVAVGDDRLSFYQYATESTVNLTREVELTQETRYVFHDKNHIGIVNLNPEKDGLYEMHIYDATGRETIRIPFDLAYDDIDIFGNEIICYNEHEMAIYYLDGKCKVESELASNYSIILPAPGKNQYITFGNEIMQILETYVGKNKESE